MPATLKTRLDGIALALQPAVSTATKAGAEIVGETAVANLVAGGHVVNDDLGQAVHVENVGPGEYSVLAGDEDVFYGHMLEHGTTHSPPYPFLVPALETEEDTILALVGGALRGL